MAEAYPGTSMDTASAEVEDIPYPGVGDAWIAGVADIAVVVEVAEDPAEHSVAVEVGLVPFDNHRRPKSSRGSQERVWIL